MIVALMMMSLYLCADFLSHLHLHETGWPYLFFVTVLRHCLHLGFFVSSPCVAQFSRTFANRLFLGLPASSCVVYMTIPARQGLTRHQRAISYGIKVYISPTGLQLRFRFTMVASMSVPVVEWPPRHVTCPFLNLLTPYD